MAGTRAIQAAPVDSFAAAASSGASNRPASMAWRVFIGAPRIPCPEQGYAKAWAAATCRAGAFSAAGALDDAGGGVAVVEVEDHHLAAVGGDFLVAGDGFRLVVAALDQQIGQDAGDEAARGVLGEGHGPVHALERGEHAHAVGDLVERSRRAL